jgi:hypothetical protein
VPAAAAHGLELDPVQQEPAQRAAVRFGRLRLGPPERTLRGIFRSGCFMEQIMNNSAEQSSGKFV